jgi:hypothetical protein
MSYVPIQRGTGTIPLKAYWSGDVNGSPYMKGYLAFVVKFSDWNGGGRPGKPFRTFDQKDPPCLQFGS